MTKSPFSPLLALSPLVKSITYVESRGHWGTNPPPATNLKLHAISHLNQILYLAFDWQLNAQNPFAVVSEPLSRIIADI
jgi:hypothetical protein